MNLVITKLHQNHYSAGKQLKFLILLNNTKHSASLKLVNWKDSDVMIYK
jgi:hypothetical protein